MALDLFFFSGFSLYPSLSLSLSTLHIALPQEVQEVCEVGGSGGGSGGGGEERTSPEISECDSFSCQEFVTKVAEAQSLSVSGNLLCGDPLWHLDLIYICIEKNFS